MNQLSSGRVTGSTVGDRQKAFIWAAAVILAAFALATAFNFAFNRPAVIQPADPRPAAAAVLPGTRGDDYGLRLIDATR